MSICPHCDGSTIFKASPWIHSHVLDNSVKMCGRTADCGACQKYLDHERKINDARRVLQQLLDERENMASMLNQHHDPFAHHLPVELASRIFFHCLPVVPAAHTSSTPYNDKQVLQAVIAPSQVNRNWRRIAQSTPEIWTILCATIGEKDDTASGAIVQQWLAQSGALPLFVQLVVRTPSRTVLDFIISHAGRFQTLDLTIPYQQLSWMSDTLSTVKFDNLEHFKFDIRPNSIQHSQPLRLNASPIRLNITFVWLDQLLTDLGRLTHFVAESINFDEATQLFLAAPRLVSFQVDALNFDSGDDVPTGMLRAPALQFLTVYSFPNEFWEIFLCPSLKTLDISHLQDGYAPLSTCLRRSECQVKELTLEDDGIQYQDEVLALLKIMPNLECLSLRGDILLMPFFSKLAAARKEAGVPGHHAFLGSLKVMTCTTNDVPINLSEVVDFSTTMQHGQDQPFRFFELQYIESHSDESYDKMIDQDTFKSILGAAHGLDLKIIDHKGKDLVERMRQRFHLL